MLFARMSLQHIRPNDLVLATESTMIVHSGFFLRMHTAFVFVGVNNLQFFTFIRHAEFICNPKGYGLDPSCPSLHILT